MPFNGLPADANFRQNVSQVCAQRQKMPKVSPRSQNGPPGWWYS